MFFNPDNIPNSGQGIQGPRGPKGDKGDTGPQGPKGEKGDSGIVPSDMVDYTGNQHESLKAKNDADVEWLLDMINSIQGEFNIVHYEGLYIAATDTLAGQAKDAILKGNTLVNKMINAKYRTAERLDIKPNSNNEFINTNNSGEGFNILPLQTSVFEPNKTYTFFLFLDEIGDGGLDKLHYFVGSERLLKIGLNKGLYTTGETVADNIYKHNIQIRSSFKARLVIVEGDYVNQDISYFDDIQSVNNPVLTTIGKNLFNYQDEDLNCYYSTNSGAEGKRIPHGGVNSYCIEVLPNTTYTLSYKSPTVLGLSHISYWNENKVYITGETDKKDYQVRTITTPENCKYIKFPLANTGVYEIQVEQGRLATSYEPYKLNVLTANEDITLRGIGDMKDTLDISTGELTTRIGEVVLDGSSDEEYIQSGLSLNNTIAFGIVLYDIKPKGASINSKFITTADANNRDYEHSYSSIHNNKSLVWFFINKGKLSSLDVSGFRQWLSQNAITLQYELATPVNKRVDLSDNHVYSYNNITYYICSSADGSLVPTLSFYVPTKLNALVSRQKDIIQELTQENESLKAAQQILLNSQLSFYESLVSAIPSLMPTEGQVNIPDFIQDLYKLKNNLK